MSGVSDEHRRARPEAAWLSARPPERVDAGGVVLERTVAEHVAELIEAINDSLAHLAPWMPWAAEPASEDSVGEFLARGRAEWEAGTGFMYVIRDRASGALVGGCGLHARRGVGVLEIGYWVRVGHVRRGVATAAARALTEAAFALEGVERVEIRPDETNEKSAGVPRTLGYRLERLERRPPRVTGETEREMVWVLERR